LHFFAGAPIGEYLYSIKAEWDEKAARVRDAKERRTQQNASSTFVNDRSEVGDWVGQQASGRAGTQQSRMAALTCPAAQHEGQLPPVHFPAR